MAVEQIEKYLSYLNTLNYSENTRKSYELAVYQFYNYIDSIDKDFETVEDDNIYTMIDYLKTLYKYTTINLKLSAIKHFYKFIKIEFPADVFIRNERPELYPLSDKELKAFNKWVLLKSDNIRIPLQIMLNTGIRVHELSKLKITDFIEINKKHYIKINNTKNYSSRIIPLNKKLYEDAIQYYNDNVFFGTVFDFTIRNYQYHMGQFSKLFGINATLHTLRRTYATYLQSEGTPVEVIQKLLGHKNIQTTMIYIKITDKEIQKLHPIDI